VVPSSFGSGEELPYKVVNGSGMGLTHSPRVAEAAFLTRCEIPMLSNNDKSKFGVRWYFRFKGDTIIKFGDPKEKWHEFFSLLKQEASPFEIECTAVSRSSIEYLELELCNCDGMLVSRPRFKQTKLQGPILAMDSDHHPKVLANWQSTYIK